MRLGKQHAKSEKRDFGISTRETGGGPDVRREQRKPSRRRPRSLLIKQLTHRKKSPKGTQTLFARWRGEFDGEGDTGRVRIRRPDRLAPFQKAVSAIKKRRKPSKRRVQLR